MLSHNGDYAISSCSLIRVSISSYRLFFPRTSSRFRIQYLEGIDLFASVSRESLLVPRLKAAICVKVTADLFLRKGLAGMDAARIGAYDA